MLIHSWNPEAAGWMAALYGPALRGSTHEQLEVRQKTRSQARSIGRAARMVLAHEAERGAPYAVAVMLRSDLVIKERRVTRDTRDLHGYSVHLGDRRE